MHRTIFSFFHFLFLVLPGKGSDTTSFLFNANIDNPIYTPRSELLLLHFISCHDFPFIQVFNLAASIAYHLCAVGRRQTNFASGDSPNE